METKSKLKKGLFGKLQRKAPVLVIWKKARSKSRTAQSRMLDKNSILVRTPHTKRRSRKKMKPVRKGFYMKANPVSNITSEYSTRKLSNDNIPCGDNARYNVGNNNHRLQNIDQKPQLSNSFKRMLSKKYSTRANVSTGKTRHSRSTCIYEVKSKSMKMRKDSSAIEKSGINFKPSISINLQSRLTSGLEYVDFSNLVRHVSFPTKSELAYGTINETSKMSDRNVSRIQTNVMSPTCADIFGYDEEEHVFSCSSIAQINLNNLNQIKQPSSVENENSIQSSGEIIERNNISAKSDSDNDNMGVNNNACKVDVTPNSVCRNELPKSSPSMKLKQERLKLMKGAAAISESTDIDPNEAAVNPWVLQNDIHMEAESISVTSYQSLGFTVNADSVIQPMSTDGRNLTRRDSQSSADSFSSCACSVSEDALYFSDSEAEMQQEDDISSTTPVNLGRPQAKHHSSMYAMTDWNKLCSIDSLENINDDDNDNEFALKNKLSRSSRLKQTVSLGNIVAKLSNSKHVSDSNGISFDSADKNNLNLSIWKRRSLDDSKNMPPFIAAIVNEEHIISACSVLSPVMESRTSVPMRSQNRKQHNEKYNTISHIRKGKGRSYPEGSQQIKKRSRIESFSKMLSKKSFTLGKNGLEFELRRDKKDSDKPRFFKTHSLTSLVSKGAASLTNLITGSGRTNSSISVSSPFNQGRKNKPSAVEEATELVYEKVKILQPRKRPANSHEITAAKKRLKLALSVNNAESPTVGSYYTDSPNTKPRWSSAHSPTLLDEIMKSIDITRFCSMKLKQNAANSDMDDDSSSKSSVSMPIYNPYSAGSDLIDLESASPTHMGVILISVCRVCGKIKNSSEINSPVVEERSYTRHSTSLCDLTSNCSCSYSRPRVNSATYGAIFGTIKRYRNSTDLSLEQMNKDLSSITLDSPRCVAPSASADLALNIHSSELAKESHLASSKNTSISMYELRDIPQLPFLHFDEIDTSSRDDKEHDKKTQTQNYASRESLPGSLLRHRPILDLSADDIDSISDDELCIPVETYDSVLSKSLGNLSIPGSTSQLAVSVQNDEERSHSCCDLLNSSMSSDVVCAIPQFVSDTQVKKGAKKIKVKSLSSSHNALTSFTADELHDIECDGEFDERLGDRDIATKFMSTVFNRNDEFDSGVSNNSSGNVENKCNISDKLNTSSVSVSYEPEQKSCIDVMSNMSQYVESKCKQHGNYDQYNEKDSADFLPGFKICKSCIKQKRQTTVRSIGKKTQNVQSNVSGMGHPKTNIQHLSPTEGRALVNILCPMCKHRIPGIHKMVSNKTYNDRKIKSDSDLDGNSYSQMDHVTSKSSINHKCNPILPSPESLVRFSPKYVAVRRALFGPLNDTDANLLLTSPSEETSSDAQRFAFDEQEVNKYLKFHSMSQLERLKSVSDDEVSYLGLQKKLMLGDKSWSSHKSSRLAALSLSQEIFSRLSFPIEMSSPVQDSPADTILWSPPFSKDFRESPIMSNVEEVCKYDISLGYLLHSLTCDNQTICVYSLQRNKQLMEGVITPIAALPGVAHPKSADSQHGSKQKSQTKTKQEDMPNPAAPITVVPSDKLLQASHVLRTVLLLRASHMIRDRKFHLRTYRRCMVGTEMVDWLLQQSSLVHSRTQAVGMWQALVEEGVIVHVCHEHQFKDKYLFYRFSEDDEGVGTVPTSTTKKECEDELQHVFMMLAQIGPDAMMRMILRKLPHERTMEDLEIIYEELLHIKALSHLSTMVKRELASVLVFESHAKAGTVLFNQGDEGKSWYIILKGSVNVVIYGKGVVCTLHEGDDFGKLALVNDAPRAATIVLRDDNCHFLRVDKDDFNRILRDVEANTVRLKEHGQDVLVLEKIPSNTQSADGTVQAHYKYSIMAGTPEKMLEHLLESRLDNKGDEEIDGFLEDFLLTHVIYMPCNHLCPVLISNYHSSMSDSTEQEAFEFMLNHKKCVLHFVQEWANIVGTAFREDHTINAFLQELHSSVHEDLELYPALQEDLAALDMVLQSATSSPDGRPKRRPGLSLALGKKSLSRDNMLDGLKKRKSKKATDENIFKVYCADHTYSTLRLPMDTTVEQIIFSIRDKLCLGEDLVLCEVKSTGERVICKENDLCVTSGLSINGCLFITPREHLDALTPLPEQEGPSQGSWYTIEMVSSKELAYHMTTYDWELFTCVQEYELIYQVFGRHKFHKITANLDLFLKRFNEIQFWVVTEMVLLTNLSKRVSLLRKFIKLASYCKDFQNLNSFFAIVMGLSNIAVSRLSQTWEKLPGKFKKMFADFETLMDPSRNHRVYRLSVAKMVPPIIPFMPLLMKDMTFTHEGNKTYFDGLVNFEKMHMIAQTLKTVRFCRSSNLDLETPGPLKSADISGYIRNLQVIDNQRLLTQLSHKLEPRKT